MKKYLGLLIISMGFGMYSSYAQVGMNTNNPNKDAALDLNDSDGTAKKGLLLPKVALTATTSFAPMTAHTTGMHVYNTATTGDVTPGEYYNDGTKWIRVGVADKVWSLTGNAASDGDYLGTNDNVAFRIKTNGIERINVLTPITTLATTPQIVIGPKASTPVYNTVRLLLDNGTTNGAIQLKTASAKLGALLTTDGNGVADWVADNGIVYHSTVAQTFIKSPVSGPDNFGTLLQTGQPMVFPTYGNYLIVLRWWGHTDMLNYEDNTTTELMVSVMVNGSRYFLGNDRYNINLNNKNGSLLNPTTFTVSFFITAAAGDVLSLRLDLGRLTSAKMYTGKAGIIDKYMPSVVLVKI